MAPGFRRRFEPFRVLPQAQVDGVWTRALQVLSHTGVAFEDERALHLLKENGCTVDFDSRRVRFPEVVVLRCLESTPGRYTIRARDPEWNWTLGDPDVTYFLAASSANTVDLDTWRPRPPTRKEFYDYIKLLDALPNVHGMPAFPWFGFAKVPQAMRLVEGNAAKLRMSTKVQREGSVMDGDLWNIEMARATHQDIAQAVNPAAPLTCTRDTVTKVLRYVEADMPFSIISAPMPGATGPASIEGSLISCTAEHIATLALAQMVRPGVRLWSGNMILMQNMRSGSPAFGQVGNFLLDAAFQQVWRGHGVPTSTTIPAWTDAKQIDYQAAYETAVPAMLAALAGASIVCFQGGLTQQLSAHPVKAVLDDDIAGMIGRYLKGIDLDPEAVALIDEVGPIPGSFLITPHTRSWWKREQFLTGSADHLTYPEWFRQGCKTALDYAREKAEEIVRTHRPVPLPPEQENAIEDILREARQFYRLKGMISEEEWRLYQEDLGSPDYPYG